MSFLRLFLSKNEKILRGLFFSKKQIPRDVLHLRFFWPYVVGNFSCRFALKI